MRIAMATEGATAGRDSADLAAALTGLGHDVVLHVDIHQTHRRQDTMVRWFTDEWRTTRPDVVHNRSRLAGAAAVRAAGILAIPVVHTVRGTEGALAGPVDGDIARHADRVIASCFAELSELVAGQVPRNRISVVPYGVDIDHFTPDAPDGAHPPRERRHFTPDGDRPPRGRRRRLSTIGDLTHNSGFATAVAALAGLPDAELVISGAPPRGNHAKELWAYAGHLGVADRLRIEGPVDRATLPSVLRSTHVVLATPWRPHFGVIALEAAACGVAVVANDTGGLADTVVDGITGLLVPPHRPRALAAAIGKLLARPMLLEQYGASARDRAVSRYAWTQIAIDTLSTYRQAGADVISQHPTHGRETAMHPDR